MDLKRLHAILNETTVQLRKGDEIEGDPELVGAIKEAGKQGGTYKKPLPGGVAHIYAMPHQSEAPSSIEKVDLQFIVVGVDKTKAEEHRRELVTILKQWPDKAWGTPVPKLEDGPSYIHAGGVIGDQGAAFQLFALGKVLGFWDVITPASMGITGPLAEQAAGAGMIMISGFKPC